MKLRVEGLRLWGLCVPKDAVGGLGVTMEGLWSLGFGVEGLGIRVQGLGFRV